ncbi:MAG: hypothetical protein R3261_11250 [Alphaproteobacteria bacterium]|nr:hypothetical protein [Alphaproteobacteria bacterium]
MKQRHIFDDDGHIENRSAFDTIFEVKAKEVGKYSSLKAQRLFDWWNSYTPDLPSYSEFDISQHIKDADGYFLYNVISPTEYDIRLIGENASSILGNKYAHTKIDTQTMANDMHLYSLVSYLQRIINQSTALSCHGTYIDTVGRKRKFQSVDCPMREACGEIKWIIGVIEEIK